MTWPPLYYKVKYAYYKLTPVGYEEIKRSREYLVAGIEEAIDRAKHEPDFMSDAEARIIKVEEL